MMFDYATLMPQVIALAKTASETILNYYHGNKPIEVTMKSDESPVTAADLAANAIITEGLCQLTPTWPILAEESVIPAYEKRQHWDHFWCVDPLDGTKGFLRKTDDFAVSIALVKEQEPVLGVIYHPMAHTVYYANRYSRAYRQSNNEMPVTIKTRPLDLQKVTVAVSRFHKSEKLAPVLQQLSNIEELRFGSALKSCFVAEGRADIYPRLGPTSAWDTAAAQCIVEQAGGKIMDLQGQPLRYNREESLVNPSFIVVGDPNFDWISFFTKIIENRR